MPQVVGQRDRFGQILVQFEGSRNVARNRCHLHCMRETRAIMVSRAVEKYLRLVLQPAKCPRMNYPVTIALELRPPFRRLLVILAPARLAAKLSVRCQSLLFELL